MSVHYQIYLLKLEMWSVPEPNGGINKIKNNENLMNLKHHISCCWSTVKKYFHDL